MVLVLQDIFREFMTLGLVSSYDEFSALFDSHNLASISREDIHIVLLAQLVALDVHCALLKERADRIRELIDQVES